MSIIISSRALEYNVLKQLVGKKVALVDDVVVKGTSITKATNNLKEAGIEPDIYIAACGTDFIQNESFEYKILIQEPYVILSEIAICELATYITQYIEVSGCPYNIDQPIYKVCFKNCDEVNEFYRDNNFIDITSKTQQEYGIHSRVIHFNSSILRHIFPQNISLDHVFLKIRMIHHEETQEILFLPFILLPEISYSQLEQLYQLVSTPLLDSIIQRTNLRVEYENKLNIFQYVFSNIFFIKYIREVAIDFSLEKVNSNEIAQFSQCIYEEDELDYIAKKFFQNIDIIYCQTCSYIDSFIFNRYVSKVYDLVLSKTSTEIYLNAKGNEITKNVITIKLLEKYINECDVTYDKYALSNLIDVFIDRGIFVPSVVHTRKQQIMRAYKGGEVAQISEKEMNLFSYMLGLYLDSGKRDYLDKLEYEKLCVLFFRSATKKDIFPNLPSGKMVAAEGDRYEISYAKFGPRVSVVHGQRYEAGHKTLLADEMTELELLGITRKQNENGEYIDKYYVNDDKKTFEDETWSDFAQIVAYDFDIFRKCFLSCYRNRIHESGSLFYYIPTYNKFLTLLSIGENEKERLLSLVAEIYLFSSIKIDGLSVRKVLVNIKNIYDGICSGVWKYCCYSQKSLLKQMVTQLSRYHNNVVRSSMDYVSKAVDHNPNIASYIDECGGFLRKLAYSLYMMGVKYNVKFSDTSMDFKFVFSECFEDKEVCDFGETTDTEVLQILYEFRMEAGALLDQCDIFLKEDAMFYKVLKSVFVIYSGTDDLPNTLQKTAIKVDLGSSRNKYNYVLISRIDNIDLVRQLEEIINECQQLQNAKIILCNMKEDYEGIYYSRNISKGRNFDKFLEGILALEEKNYYNNRMEFVVYYPYGDNLPELKSEIFQFHISNTTFMKNGYNMTRYYVTQNTRPVQINGQTSYYIREVNEMNINQVSNSKIIENNGSYIEGSLVINNNNFDPALPENIANLQSELDNLKAKVDEERAVIIGETVIAAQNKDNPKIKDGLKKIANFGKDVFSSVAATTISSYMAAYGIIPPM